MESIQKTGVITGVIKREERNSGIELVKVIAILLIICSHVVQTLGGGNSDYTIDLSTATTDWVRLLITMLRYSGALGNTLFFVCSAWFLLDSKQVSGQKIVSMLLDVWIISASIFAVVFFVRHGDLSLKMVVKSFFPTTFANNWYITCYLLFYPIHPTLNKVIASMTQKALFLTSFTLCFLYIGMNYISGFFFSSALILWVAIYFLMAYMKIYTPKLMASRRANFIGLLVGIIGNYGIILATNLLGLRLSFFENELLHWDNNCSPFLILIAISALNLSRMASFHNKMINYISKLSLLIYVIHENLLLRTYYRPMMWHQIYISVGYDHILLWILLMVVALFLFGLVASIAYKYTLQRLVPPLSKKLCIGIGKGFDCIANAVMKIQ